MSSAPSISPEDRAERRQVTVMFCDLVGSTALSRRVDPEDLREVISTYQNSVAVTVGRFGGFVARYIGDGVLAYFGYPQAHEHDAERAVRAGLALVEEVPKVKTAAGVPMQVRVGIATGLVVVGDLVGGGSVQEHEVVGETPNLAARLQALAEPGTAVISSSTRRLTGGLFDCRDLGTVALKGFAETVPAWQVLGASAVESRFAALRGSTTPLVGRGEEIDLLLRRCEQAKGGEGSVVLLSGEPGIGKSRIAETVLERLSSEPHMRLRLFCSPHHQDTALYPSITQLERAAGFRRDDTDEQRLTKLEAVLALAANDLGEAVPLLAGLLSIPIGDRYPALDLTPQKRKEKTLRALVAQVEGLAARQPVLLVVEDAHWADPTSLELFELIVERASSLPLLAIVTFRPEFVLPWVGRPQVTLISLSRLPRRLRAEMIAHVTGGKVLLPQEIADQIIDRTDGVPLFIEELTKAVVESGLLVEAGGRYVATGPVAPLAIPTSLQESLLARLDRLAPTSDVAQIAAALGRQFSHELIRAVAAMPRQQLDDALAQLVNAELIFRRGTPPDAEYTFKHALVQEAAYGTLLRSRRQQIHTRIATTLEDQFPDLVVAQPALLARHCAEAGLAEKTVVYWLKAGQQALARSATTEAAAQLRKGLDALDGLPDGPGRQQLELDLQLALGYALIAAKGFSAPEVGETLARARAHLPRTLELAQRQGRAAQVCSVQLQLGSVYWLEGRYEEGLQVTSEGLRTARALGSPALIFSNQTVMANVLHGMGRVDRAIAEMDELNEMLRGELETARLGAPAGPKCTVLAFRSWFMIATGQYGEALEFASRALQIAAREQDLFGEVLARIAMGRNLLMLHRNDEAVECLSIGREIVERKGYNTINANLTGALATALARTGKAYQAIGLAEAYMESGMQRWTGQMEVGYLYAGYAEAVVRSGELERGLSVLDQALSIAKTIKNPWLTVECLGLRARLLAETKPDAPRVAQDLAEMRAICGQHGVVAWDVSRLVA